MPIDPDTEPPGIVVRRNGPLFMVGSVEVRRQNGQLICRRNRVALCRCGQSKDKPFCDGTHKTTGFEAE